MSNRIDVGPIICDGREVGVIRVTVPPGVVLVGNDGAPITGMQANLSFPTNGGDARVDVGPTPSAGSGSGAGHHTGAAHTRAQPHAPHGTHVHHPHTAHPEVFPATGHAPAKAHHSVHPGFKHHAPGHEPEGRHPDALKHEGDKVKQDIDKKDTAKAVHDTPEGEGMTGVDPLEVKKKEQAAQGEGVTGPDSVKENNAARTSGGIDRSRFRKELDDSPHVSRRIAEMVKGEVGDGAPLTTKQVQAETFFNRMLVQKKSAEAGITPVYPQRGGYYPGSTFRNGKMTDAEYENYKRDVIDPVVAGSHVSEDLLGFPATGNASNAPGNEVANHQFAMGTRGGWLPAYGKTKEAYFLEHPAALNLPRNGDAGPPSEAQKARPTSTNDDFSFLSERGAHSTMNMVEHPLGDDAGFSRELAARLAAAGREYEATHPGERARYGEGDRDDATQAVYWRRFKAGTGGIAAPPGRSRHQHGEAMDIPDTGFRAWLKEGNMNRLGLHFPVRGDRPHVQANPAFSGSFASKAPSTSAPASSTSSGGNAGNAVLFLHGMQSKYNQGGINKSPAEIEADAHRLATRLGVPFEVIDVSGDFPVKQEAAARARIQKGGIGTVFGLSAGGYTANRLQKQFPNLKYIKTGAPHTKDDIEIPGVKHMNLPGAVADSYN